MPKAKVELSETASIHGIIALLSESWEMPYGGAFYSDRLC